MRLKAGWILAALLLAAPAHAGIVWRAAAAANAITFDAVAPKPNDVEVGGNLAASLQPHISAVGALAYGFDHSYLRGSVGARFTASNVDDPNFSVGLGMAYHVSSEPGIRPEGWAPDASIGWRPWPVDAPRVNLILQGQYQLEANQASAIMGVRYEIGGQP